jgi:hypothetical protein
MVQEFGRRTEQVLVSILTDTQTTGTSLLHAAHHAQGGSPTVDTHVWIPSLLELQILTCIILSTNALGCNRLVSSIDKHLPPSRPHAQAHLYRYHPASTEGPWPELGG